MKPVNLLIKTASFLSLWNCSPESLKTPFIGVQVKKKKDLKNVRIRVDPALFSSKRSELSTARERVSEWASDKSVEKVSKYQPRHIQDWDYDSLYYNM